MRIKVFLFSIFLAFLYVVPVYTESDSVVISDNQELFLDEEAMYERLSQIAEANNISIGVLTDYTEQRAVDLSWVFQSNTFGDSERVVVFVINMQERVIWLRVSDDLLVDIDNQSAYSITDNVYYYASSEDYDRCVIRVFEQVEILLQKGHIPQPMRVLCNLLLSLVFGVSITYMVIVFSRMKMTSSGKKESEFGDYRFNINMVSDLVTKTRTISRGSSGSGSGGSHHSGGGRSGGSSRSGGGHRF